MGYLSPVQVYKPALGIKILLHVGFCVGVHVLSLLVQRTAYLLVRKSAMKLWYICIENRHGSRQ